MQKCKIQNALFLQKEKNLLGGSPNFVCEVAKLYQVNKEV